MSLPVVVGSGAPVPAELVRTVLLDELARAVLLNELVVGALLKSELKSELSEGTEPVGLF